MKLSKVDTLVFEALEDIAPIETARVSMFDITDKYSYFPFLRFRFKNKEKEDMVYRKIKDIINGFEGNLKWDLVTKTESKNFLILPVITRLDKNVSTLDERTYFISLYGEDHYKKKIDDCIDDIPKLAKVISSCC